MFYSAIRSNLRACAVTSMFRRNAALGAVLLAAPLLLPNAAQAQLAQVMGPSLLDQFSQEGVPGYAAEPGTTVLSRARPDYDPLGVRAGDFIIRPEVVESLGYNDNLLGTNTGEKSSFEEDTAASMGFASDWRRDSLGGAITVDDRRTLGLSQLDRTDWTASLGGTYQIGRDVLTLAAAHLSQHEDPTGIDAQAFNVPGQLYSQPIPYTVDDIRIKYAADFGRISLTPDFDYTRFRFSDLKLFGINGALVPPTIDGFAGTVPVSQSYRNRDIYSATITGRYEFAPLRNAVLLVRDTNSDYLSSAATFGPSRSSNSVDVLAGLEYASSAVWRYRVLVGYEIRQFNNSAAYPTHSAPVAEANIIWQPTGLTTVTFRALRSIEDAADENVAGYDYTSAQLRADHELFRNVLLSGHLVYQNASYLQSNGEQTFYTVGGGVTYLLNRLVHITATYDLTDSNGKGGYGPAYLQNMAMLQFHLAL
jgi:hypothetical protein